MYSTTEIIEFPLTSTEEISLFLEIITAKFKNGWLPCMSITDVSYMPYDKNNQSNFMNTIEQTLSSINNPYKNLYMILAITRDHTLLCPQKLFTLWSDAPGATKAINYPTTSIKHISTLMPNSY
jgi:hypothetical protein